MPPRSEASLTRLLGRDPAGLPCGTTLSPLLGTLLPVLLPLPKIILAEPLLAALPLLRLIAAVLPTILGLLVTPMTPGVLKVPLPCIAQILAPILPLRRAGRAALLKLPLMLGALESPRILPPALNRRAGRRGAAWAGIAVHDLRLRSGGARRSMEHRPRGRSTMHRRGPLHWSRAVDWSGAGRWSSMAAALPAATAATVKLCAGIGRHCDRGQQRNRCERNAHPEHGFDLAVTPPNQT